MVEPEDHTARVANVPQTKGLYFGWWIVIMSAVLHGIMGGLYQTGLSIYFLQLTRDFKVSYTKLSVAFALRTLEGGAEGPVVGFLADRFGTKLVIVVGVLMGGLGFVLLAATRSYGMFLLVFLSLVTIGFSMPYTGYTVAINDWFRRRLALAMSLSASGTAIGGFLLTPAVAWVVLNHGWRWGALATGLVVMVVGLPLALKVRKPTAGESAMEEQALPTSAAGSSPNPAPENSSRLKTAHGAATPPVDFTIGEAVRTRTYWLLAVAIGLRLMAKSALTVHMVPLLVSRGVSEAVAATLLAVFSLLRLPAMIGAGLLADQWSRPKVVAMSMILGAIGAATMVWGPTGLVSGLMFAVLFAGAQASDSITWAMIGQYFGRKNFGVLRGGITMVQSLMSTIGPIGAGWVFDRTGSYGQALTAAVVTYVLAAAAYWALRAPARPMREGAVRPQTQHLGSTGE